MILLEVYDRVLDYKYFRTFCQFVLEAKGVRIISFLFANKNVNCEKYQRFRDYRNSKGAIKRKIHNENKLLT